MGDITRSIEEICEESPFSMIIHDKVYCKLAYKKKIDCKYLSDEKDHNFLYYCQKIECLQEQYDPDLYDVRFDN